MPDRSAKHENSLITHESCRCFEEPPLACEQLMSPMLLSAPKAQLARLHTLATWLAYYTTLCEMTNNAVPERFQSCSSSLADQMHTRVC